MSQNDFTLANQSFPAFRADLNSALQALASNNSGGSAPSTMFANMWWYDSANNIMYIRNEDNDAWIKFAELDQTNDKFVLSGTLQLDDGTVSAPALTFNSDTNMGIYRGGTDILKFVTAGTDAITIDANQNTTFAGEVTADDLNLSVGTGGDGIQITSTGANYLNIGLDTNRTGSSQTLTQMEQKWNGTTVARLNFITGTDTTNKDDGEIRLQTASAGTPLNRIRVENNGDISFYEDTGTTPKFFWDSSAESLGLGTASPAHFLDVVAQNAGTDATMRIKTTGTQTYSDAFLYLETAGSGITGIAFGDSADDNVGLINYDHSDNSLYIRTNATRALTIDNSQNLLVGTTDSSVFNNSGSGTGINLQNFGNIAVARDSNDCMALNRLNSDGSILVFNKDGATVGSIASRAGSVSTIILDPTATGGGISGGGGALYPTDHAGTLSDGALTLGDASYRWNNLYLSGGVYLGGTDSLHKLDDYEEGTWIPGVEDYGGTATFADANFTKIGRIVHASVKVLLDGTSDASGFKVNGLPFTSLNTTNSLFGGYISYTSSTLTDNIYVFVESNNTKIKLYTTGGSSVSYNDIGANKEIRLVVTYFTT
jgi:hypothetical protein